MLDCVDLWILPTTTTHQTKKQTILHMVHIDSRYSIKTYMLYYIYIYIYSILYNLLNNKTDGITSSSIGNKYLLYLTHFLGG